MKKLYHNLSFLYELNNKTVLIIHILVISTVLFAISFNSYIKKADLAYGDWLSKLYYFNQDNIKSNEDFAVVEIDNQSFHFLAKSFGSIRISVAKLIHILKKEQPKCIIVNYLFYGKGLSVEDIYLTAAADANIPIFFRAELTNAGEYFTPIEAFSSKKPLFGFLKFVPSEDDIIRKIIINDKIHDMNIQHDLSSQISQLINPSDKKRKSEIMIRFSTSPEDVDKIKAFNLIQNKFKKHNVKNKIVIIDGTASIYQNKLNTPIGIMPESIALINAIKTQLSQKKHFFLIQKHFTFLSILIFVSILAVINFKSSLTVSILTSSGLFIFSFLMFAIAYKNEIITPYAIIILSIIFPNTYFLLLRYLFLSKQSKKLMRLATLDPLTGLYSFKYFSFVLQRMFIRQKKKNKNLTLSALQFIDSENQDEKSFETIPAELLHNIGVIIKHGDKRNKIYGTSNDKNICFIAYQKINKKLVYEKLNTMIKKLKNVIALQPTNLQIKAVMIDLHVAQTDSSIHLIQALEFMLKQKTKDLNRILEYEPSELNYSFPAANTNILPETELSYVTEQISEDKKDLQLMKQRLNKSIHEYTMAQKLTAMGQLSSYYAHELKNPLHNLLNTFEILEDPDETENEKKEILQLMKNELIRVSSLAENMGSHFRPSKQTASEKDINVLIDSTIKLFEKKIKQNKIRIFTHLDSTIPSIMLIEDQIKQVILNLILNAMEAMPQGGNLDIATYYLPPVIKITITDTGVGINPIDLERIFEAFYTTKNEKGTGLGLFASYNIIQQHGGTLKVESTKDQGTVFEIILPT